MAIGFATGVELKGQLTVVAAVDKSLGNGAPIGNAVIRQLVQVVKPSRVAAKVAYAQVVVDVRAKQPVAIQRKHIFAVVVAHLVPRIPTKADVRLVGKCLHNCRKVFLALGVFKRKANAAPHQGFCRRRTYRKIRQSLPHVLVLFAALHPRRIARLWQGTIFVSTYLPYPVCFENSFSVYIAVVLAKTISNDNKNHIFSRLSATMPLTLPKAPTAAVCTSLSSAHT